jgi:excisionase family DNA binding protein
MDTIATPEFLSPSEVARRLGLSRSTVYRHISAGDLPALRLGLDGTSLRVRADELEAWLTHGGRRRGAMSDEQTVSPRNRMIDAGCRGGRHG